MFHALDCVVCIQRQALEAARFVSQDPEIHERVLERTMRIQLEEGLKAASPYLGTLVHRAVREITNNPDPYYEKKKFFNRSALERWDVFQRWIRESADPFETTVRLAIAGNSIDFAMESITEDRGNAMIAAATSQPLHGSIEKLRDAFHRAKSILYLTDNAGEIVYDRLLIEALVSDQFKKDVVVVTRGAPIINDALLEDAHEVGLDAVAPVISNGGDGLGVIFDMTSDEFKERFLAADLVVAKGLANFETLWEGDPRFKAKEIAFLFKVKCPFIAKVVGANLNDLAILLQS